jgi:hypothetical protein
MAFTPTPVATRIFQSADLATFSEYCTMGITGTYVTGGFTWNPIVVFAGKGSSPLPAQTVLSVEFFSPTGHTYFTTVSGQTATTKIFAGVTELANGAAAPNASINLTIIKKKA